MKKHYNLNKKELLQLNKMLSDFVKKGCLDVSNYQNFTDNILNILLIEECIKEDRFSDVIFHATKNAEILLNTNYFNIVYENQKRENEKYFRNKYSTRIAIGISILSLIVASLPYIIKVIQKFL